MGLTVLLRTFAGGEVEVEVDYVGAAVVAWSRAELGGELGVEECVGGDPGGVPINPTSPDAVVGLNPLRHLLHHHLRRPALELRLPIAAPIVLQQAPLPRRGYGQRAHLNRQLLADNLTCPSTITHQYHPYKPQNYDKKQVTADNHIYSLCTGYEVEVSRETEKGGNKEHIANSRRRHGGGRKSKGLNRLLILMVSQIEEVGGEALWEKK